MCSIGFCFRTYFILIYVNDIGNVINEINEKIMLFADDSNAFIINKDIMQIKQNSENKLEEWLAANKLTLEINIHKNVRHYIKETAKLVVYTMCVI